MSHFMCCVCLDSGTADDIWHSLGCGHIFHKHCLDNWFKRSKTCPQCCKKYTAKTKTTRIFPNYEAVISNDFLVERVAELERNNRESELKIQEMSQQLVYLETLRSRNDHLEKRIQSIQLELLFEERLALGSKFDAQKRVEELEIKLKNIQTDLSGRNKLIECFERVNSELELTKHELEMENRRLREQVERNDGPPTKRRRQQVNQFQNNKIIDLTDES